LNSRRSDLRGSCLSSALFDHGMQARPGGGAARPRLCDSIPKEMLEIVGVLRLCGDGHQASVFLTQASAILTVLADLAGVRAKKCRASVDEAGEAARRQGPFAFRLLQ